MAQLIARDIDYSYGRQTGRYGLKLPFAGYPTPNTTVRDITRIYRSTEAAYSPAVTNLTSYTNLLAYSDDFTGGNWNALNLTPTAAAEVDPEGNWNASFLGETATTGQFYIEQRSTTSNVQSSIGCLMKFGGRQYGCIAFYDYLSNIVASANFDLVNGLAFSSAGSCAIRSLGNGWYWCVVSGTVLNAGSSYIYIGLSDTTALLHSYAGTAGLGIYAGSATLVQGFGLTGFPPIHTTSASRTILSPDVDGVVNWPGGNDLDLYAPQCGETPAKGMQTGLVQYTKEYCRVPPTFVSPSTYLFNAPNYVGQPQTGLAGFYTPQAELIGFYAFVANCLTSETALVNGYFDLALPVSNVVTNSSGAAYVSSFTCAGNNFNPGDVLLMFSEVWSDATLQSATVISVSGSAVTVLGLQTGGYITSIAPGYIFPDTAQGYVRKLIKDVPDAGQVSGLTARVVENYYLPGVTPGINTSADIPAQSPFNIINYFAAWAAAAALQSATTTSQTFTSSGLFTVPANVYSLSVLLVGGGGGGGATGLGGGGGGGGGVLPLTTIAVTPGQVIPIGIGAGGAGGTGDGTSPKNGTAGGYTTFGPYSAVGGGGGGGGSGGSQTAGSISGGSGGGAYGGASNSTGGAGTLGQGFPGGSDVSSYHAGAGGGGAAAPGSNSASDTNGGAGGAGLTIGGTMYGAGGGGGAPNTGTGGAAGGTGAGAGASGSTGNAGSGSANTGGGGGGSSYGTGTPGPGGSGIAIVTWSAATWFNVAVEPVKAWLGRILVQKFTQALLPTIPHGNQFFTSGGTFTVPAGVYNLRRVIVIGGGGGGGSNAGGGGAGSLISLFENIAVIPGQTYTVTVGAGGAATSSGGSSSFGSMSQTGAASGSDGTGSAGGNGGAIISGGSLGGSGGGGGGDSGGVAGKDVAGTSATSAHAGTGATGRCPGGGGGATTTGASALGGAGGAYGNGAAGGNNATNGGTGPNNSGAGGGGGGASATGGSGGSGIVQVTW